MVRAYVVTFAFVTFRVLNNYGAHLTAPTGQRSGDNNWLGLFGALPLLVAEVILRTPTIAFAPGVQLNPSVKARGPEDFPVLPVPSVVYLLFACGLREAVASQRQLAHSLARGREDRVAKCGNKRRHAGFSHSGGRRRAFDNVYIDLPRSVVHSSRLGSRRSSTGRRHRRSL